MCWDDVVWESQVSLPHSFASLYARYRCYAVVHKPSAKYKLLCFPHCLFLACCPIAVVYKGTTESLSGTRTATKSHNFFSVPIPWIFWLTHGNHCLVSTTSDISFACVLPNLFLIGSSWSEEKITSTWIISGAPLHLGYSLWWPWARFLPSLCLCVFHFTVGTCCDG